MNHLKRLLLLSLLVFAAASTFAQLTTYEKFYGNPDTDDIFNDVEPTGDGGFVAVGHTNADGQSGQFYLVKFDGFGGEELNANFGTEANEEANTIAVLSDRYVLGGRRFNPETATNDAYLMTVDFAGNLLNEVVFGTDFEQDITEIIALSNGQVLVASAYETQLPNGMDVNLRIYDADLTLQTETFINNFGYEIPVFLEEIEPGGDILISLNASIIYRYSPDLSSIVWSMTGLSGGGFLQINNFADGVRLNPTTYAFVGFSAEDFDTHIRYIDITNGSFVDDFNLEILSNATPVGIEKVDDQLYVLAGDFGSTLYKFDITTETVVETSTETGTNVAMAEADGKLVTVGESFTNGAYLAKAAQFSASSIDEEWSVLSGDISPFTAEFGQNIIESDNETMLIGGVQNIGEDRFVNVKKVDKNGIVLWETNFNADLDVFSSWGLAASADGGCVAQYYYTRDDGSTGVGFQKIATNGDLEWNQTLSDDDTFLSFFGNIIPSSDGGYYFGGSKIDLGFISHIVKLDTDGNILWTNNYTVENSTTRCHNLIEAANGDIIVAGFNDGSIRQPTLMRLASDGSELWGNRYETPVAFSRFTGVVEAADGSIYATGVSTDVSFSAGVGNIHHVAANGDLLDGGVLADNAPGTTLYDIVIKEDETIHTMSLNTEQIEFPANNSLFLTRTIAVTEYDEDYNILSQDNYGFSYAPVAYRMIGHSDGGLAIYGSAGIDNTTFGYLIRIDATGVVSTFNVETQGHLKLFPTVSDGNFMIDFKSEHTGELLGQIYNGNGQMVQEFKEQKTGENWSKAVNLPDLVAGVYYVNLRMNGLAWTQQMVKQ